jgi:cell division protein FtsL
MERQRTVAAALVVLIGIVALAVGVIYLTVEARSLPSVLGALHSYSGYRSKRGVAAIALGVVLLVCAAGLLVYRPRARRAL